jgi:hypothetical protein
MKSHVDLRCHPMVLVWLLSTNYDFRCHHRDSTDTDILDLENDNKAFILILAQHRIDRRLMEEFYSMLSCMLSETPQNRTAESFKMSSTTSR